MKLSAGAILELSNSKRQASTNLSRGHRGRKARTAVTEAEISFCAYFVLTGNVKQASLQAGYSAWWGYELLKMPRIQPVLREFEDQKKEEAWNTAKTQVHVTREFLDEQFMYRLVNMRTHQRSGDMAIVKMFEVGNKRTGDIQTAKVTNNQTGVVVAPGGTMREVYKSKWLRDKEGALAAEFEAEANNGTMKTSRRNSN
jgi:hypothetical protein